MTVPRFDIQQERSSDYPNVYRLNKDAFGQETEADLVNAPFDVPDNAFLALELTEQALNGVHGSVEYPKEFDSV